ncbi:helix-turn-helix transcriptional regulator [Spongiactinospora sp. TRM90649]|nr:helix-turn-helix transcriptional regulator [Spongiactinospora sp. TRM90649]
MRRRRLAAELRRLRKESGLTAEAVARRVGLAQSWVSRVESARQGIRHNDLRALLDIYGVPEERRDELSALAQQSRQRGWWHSFSDAVPEWFQIMIGLEAEARRLRSFDMELIPGLLQTPDYYRSYLRGHRAGFGEPEIDRMIELRTARQERMLHNHSLDLTFIVNEASLRRLAATTSVCHAQLDRLVQLSDKSHISINILPFSAGMHSSMDSGFVLLGFTPPDPDVVYIESQLNGLYLEEPAQVESYDSVYDSLHAKSLTKEQTRNFLVKLAKEV